MLERHTKKLWLFKCCWSGTHQYLWVLIGSRVDWWAVWSGWMVRVSVYGCLTACKYAPHATHVQVCTSCHTICVYAHIYYLFCLFDQSVPHSTSIQTCPMVSVCIQWRTPTLNSTASHISAVADSWGGRDTSFPTVLYDICVLLMLFSAKQFWVVCLMVCADKLLRQLQIAP